MKRGWKRGLAGAAFIWMLSGFCLLAAEPGSVLSFGTEEKEIVVYIQNPGEEYEVQCQIGTSEAESVKSYSITEETIPIETIILLDNSLSVVEKYRPTIQTILSELAANRMNGEQFTVATFSEEVNYLLQDCSDYTQIRQTIDNITYNNQETYLTDVLYDMLTEMNKESNTVLKRFVIISDGVDNKTIGYTKEELYTLLEKTPYPIYTIGCTYGNNNEQLKNMFALSRMTGGESYLLDDVSDPMTVVNGVAKLNQAVKVVITPKKKDCDGTKKGIGLTITAGGETKTNTLEMTMPFDTEETTQEQTSTIETTTAEPATEPVVTEPEKKGIPIAAVGIGGGIVLILAVAGVVIYMVQKRKKERGFIPPDDSEKEREIGPHETEIMEGEDAGERREGTVLIWKNNTSHRLILEDVNNPVKRFEVPLTSPVLVGYSNSCQICLNYEKTVSGSHCRIYEENGKVYVENLSKTNGTLMDGKRIVNMAEVYTGCVLELGKLKMKVEIR